MALPWFVRVEMLATFAISNRFNLINLWNYRNYLRKASLCDLHAANCLLEDELRARGDNQEFYKLASLQWDTFIPGLHSVIVSYRLTAHLTCTAVQLMVIWRVRNRSLSVVIFFITPTATGRDALCLKPRSRLENAKSTLIVVDLIKKRVVRSIRIFLSIAVMSKWCCHAGNEVTRESLRLPLTLSSEDTLPEKGGD